MMLMDTCALLWLGQGGKAFSTKTREAISSAAMVYISSITAFEISLKCRQRKLLLPMPPSEWLHTILKHHNLSVIPLDLDICVTATELPPIHKDPCDRFIIATAKLHHFPIITADTRFKRYDVEVLA